MPDSNMEPPLVDVKVTNPVTYLRRWWDKVMGKEGTYFNFRIPPITSFLIAFGFGLAAFGIGRYSVDDLKLTPTPTAEVIWKETGFNGKLQFSAKTDKYFLLTTSAEAITLEVPENLNLFTLIGKRIFAVGEYNKKDKILKVADIKDLEVLPNTPIPIPTVIPTPTATPTSVFTSSPTPVSTDIIQ